MIKLQIVEITLVDTEESIKGYIHPYNNILSVRESINAAIEDRRPLISIHVLDSYGKEEEVIINANHIIKIYDRGSTNRG